MNNWTRILQPGDIPPPQSATLRLHPVARKVILISCPAEGSRLSYKLITFLKFRTAKKVAHLIITFRSDPALVI